MGFFLIYVMHQVHIVYSILNNFFSQNHTFDGEMHDTLYRLF
jgi:hypothetical protein